MLVVAWRGACCQTDVNLIPARSLFSLVIFYYNRVPSVAAILRVRPVVQLNPSLLNGGRLCQCNPTFRQLITKPVNCNCIWVSVIAILSY